MDLLDGKGVATELYTNLQEEVARLKEQNIHPKLVILLVGDDPASLSYLKSKQKASEKIGIEGEILQFHPEEMTTESLIAKLQELNADESVHGVMVQLPLPDHIYGPDVLKAIDPQKDVDGCTAYNLGKMFLSQEFEDLPPCTPLGIIKILEQYSIDVVGKDVVVVGRSNLVGKPVAIMLLNRGATVTVCHSRTKDLAAHTARADILICSVGKPKLITGDMVKEGAVVIDVGINRLDDGTLVGDCEFEDVSKRASYITPVPGGCGPMTVACLIHNTVKAAQKQQSSL